MEVFQDLTEFEGKEKKPVMESDKLQGTGDIDLKVTKKEKTEQPKADRLRIVQKLRKTGRKED